MGHKIVPLADQVLIKQVEPEKKTKSGIYLPENVKEDHTPVMAEILAIGNSKKIARKGLIVGDWVVYSRYSGTEVELDGEKYMLLSAKDILAKVEK
jgi:chaperonin GroES